MLPKKQNTGYNLLMYSSRKSYSRAPQPNKLQFRFNRNEYIRAAQLRVVSDDGENLGVLDRQKALDLARERELDLIEIAPQAVPPVARIMSWSKFKYEQEKKDKATKGKSQEQKEIWFKAFIGAGDIDHKLKKVKEFIDKKSTVKLTIRRRGRVQPEMIQELLKKLTTQVTEFSTILTEPRSNGGNYSFVVGPKKN